MEKVSGSGVLSKNFISLYFNILVILLLVFSLAGTVVSFSRETSSFEYVIAIDNSGSMRTQDILPNRLTAAKEASKRFVDSLALGTNIGVVSFAGSAEVVKILDSSKLETNMAIESIDFTNLEGTNIYSTLTTAKELFSNADFKAVIIVSDGQINIGEVAQAIKYASSNDILVNTIAVGTKEGGVTEFNTISKTDEESLQALAFNTGGRFFLVDKNAALTQSFSDILEKINKEVSINISSYLLLTALGIIIINWILFNFRFRILP